MAYRARIRVSRMLPSSGLTEATLRLLIQKSADFADQLLEQDAGNLELGRPSQAKLFAALAADCGMAYTANRAHEASGGLLARASFGRANIVRGLQSADTLQGIH
jgi:hypothetical protein